MQAKQSKESIHYFPSAGTCSATSRKSGLIMSDSEYPLLPPPILHFLLFNTMPYGLEYPFVHCRSPVWGLSLPNSCCTPSLLAGRAAQEAKKSLALRMHCSATTKPLGCYQYYSHPKSKTQPHRSLFEENNTIPAKTRTGVIVKEVAAPSKYDLVSQI